EPPDAAEPALAHPLEERVVLAGDATDCSIGPGQGREPVREDVEVSFRLVVGDPVDPGPELGGRWRIVQLDRRAPMALLEPEGVAVFAGHDRVVEETASDRLQPEIGERNGTRVAADTADRHPESLRSP